MWLGFGAFCSLACGTGLVGSGTGLVGRMLSVQCCIKPWPSVPAACSVLYELCRRGCRVWQEIEILMEEEGVFSEQVGGPCEDLGVHLELNNTQYKSQIFF